MQVSVCLMLLSTLAYSFCSFDGLNSEGKKGENEVVLNERARCVREILLPCKARSVWSRASSWVDRHVKNIRSNVGLCIAMY
jgi:hypothetical protein